MATTGPEPRVFRNPDDIRTIDPERHIGRPGTFPFTRGVQPTMYRGRPWTMRQYAGFGSAEESNRRYRYLLSQGVMGLSVAFDLPTQIGYDPDHPLAVGEVGRVGVSIATIEDMAALFDAIPMDRVSTSMTINSTALILLALYVAVARQRGIAPAALAGTIQNDILKEYVARGTYIRPPRPALRLVTDIMAFCARETPQWNSISISGYHIREAGSTAVQEVAFTLANGIAYVQAAIDAGLDADAVGQRLSFFFNAHNDFLEEVAKFRAARRLWARIMRDRFGATHPRAQQPDNNIVRVAIQALAAVLGGTQSLHCNGRDEALALPTEESARLALRTQQIIAAETGVIRTADPVGGSWAIESRTRAIEHAARDVIDSIEAAGGTLKSIETGWIQRQIQQSAYESQLAVEGGSRVIVGVNRHASEPVPPTGLLRIPESVETRQRAAVEAVRASRDQSRWRDTLAAVGAAARSDDNLMPPIIAAVEARATVGEIADVLRGVYGEYRDTTI